MWQAIAALFVRSMRMDAQRIPLHLVRLLFVFGIYFMMWMSQIDTFSGAPGMRLFGGILFMNSALIALGGVGLFSTAITEEKEEETLGLMMMAGISPLAILLGKSTSRLAQALLLLAVQFPFTFLSITLGGVAVRQIFAAYLTLLALTVLVANFGLLASIICRRSSTAMQVSTLFLIAYAFLPTFSPTVFPHWVLSSSAFEQLISIQATNFHAPLISPQVISNVVAAFVFFLLAWWLFPYFALTDDRGLPARGLISQKSSRRRWMSAGRAWSNPLIWKDYYFLAGGLSRALLYVTACTLLWLVLSAGSAVNSTWFSNSNEVLGMHLGIMVGLLILQTARYASRLFHDEIRNQTLTSLIVLPRSLQNISYSKLGGCLLGLWPLLAIIAIDITLLPDGWTTFFQMIAHSGFWGAMILLSFFLHLTVLLSLYMKWGALPTAFFSTLMSCYCGPSMFLSPFAYILPEIDWDTFLLPLILLILLFETVTFQLLIRQRLLQLSAQ